MANEPQLPEDQETNLFDNQAIGKVRDILKSSSNFIEPQFHLLVTKIRTAGQHPLAVTCAPCVSPLATARYRRVGHLAKTQATQLPHDCRF